MALTARMVTIDCADPTALAEFWTEATGYVVNATMGEGAYLVLGSESTAGLSIGLPRFAEPTPGKNRVHVDFSAPGPLSEEVSRLTGLGASFVATHEVPGFTWTVLADPAGNQFCVSSGGSGGSSSGSGGSAGSAGGQAGE